MYPTSSKDDTTQRYPPKINVYSVPCLSLHQNDLVLVLLLLRLTYGSLLLSTLFPSFTHSVSDNLNASTVIKLTQLVTICNFAYHLIVAIILFNTRHGRAAECSHFFVSFVCLPFLKIDTPPTPIDLLLALAVLLL